jgi:phosphatidylinositol glycan anchor class Y biosynthesis protein
MTSPMHQNVFGNVAFRRRGSFSTEQMYIQMQQRTINQYVPITAADSRFRMTTFLYGVLLVTVSFLAFLIFMFWVFAKFFAHLMIDFDNPPTQFEIWIKNISEDFYYVLLLPITVIVFQIFIYFNWLGMKYFKHN